MATDAPAAAAAPPTGGSAPAPQAGGGAPPERAPAAPPSASSGTTTQTEKGGAGTTPGAPAPRASDGGAAKAESDAPKSEQKWSLGKALRGLLGRYGEGEQQAEQPSDEAATGAKAEGEKKADPPTTPTREQELQAELSKLQTQLQKAGQEDAALVDELARSDDPWSVQEKAAKRAQTRRAQNSAQQVGTIISLVGRGFDANVLSPLVDAVPEADRPKVIEAGKVRGYEGRKALVVAAIDAIRKAAKAEGEAGAQKALEKDPEFLKGVLRGRRAGAVELDLVPAMAAANSGVDMNARMRAASGRPPNGRNGSTN